MTMQEEPKVEPAGEVLSTKVASSDSSLGTICIHNNVITAIARETALKVPGVRALISTEKGAFSSVLGKKEGEHGIRLEVDGNLVKIELRVVVKYGVRIPQVAWQLQHDVTESVENMTGKDVESVNVIVQHVELGGPERSEMEEGEAI